MRALEFMAKVLVLHYSTYGHIEKMAEAVAEGAREGGGSVDIKRVLELVSSDVAKASRMANFLDQGKARVCRGSRAHLAARLAPACPRRRRHARARFRLHPRPGYDDEDG